jgi:hypothetical protein
MIRMGVGLEEKVVGSVRLTSLQALVRSPIRGLRITQIDLS